MTQPLPLTSEGLARLQGLLRREQVRLEEARAVVQEQMAANENESLDLAAAQETLAALLERTGELADQIARAVVLTPGQSAQAGCVGLGSRVTLLSSKLERRLPVQLVSAAEAAAGLGSGPALVSSESPVGQALLGRRVGEEFTVELGGTQLHYRVLEIEE